MRNKIGLLMVFMLAVIVMATSAFADQIPVKVQNVEIEGSDVSQWGSTSLDVKRGEEIEVDFEIVSDNALWGDTEYLEDVEVEVTIRGYDHSDRGSLTEYVDMSRVKKDVRYREDVTLRVPQRVDEDTYYLRFVVFDRNNELLEQNYVLTIDNRQNEVMIKDVVFSPEGGVLPGRAFLASVRVRNYGFEEEDSVRVSMSIPELGVSASDYIDELEEGDTETSEELFLRIPETAEPGTYTTEVKVVYDDGDEVETSNFEMTVLEEVKEEPTAQETTYVSGETEPQTGKVGETLSYPVTISNVGATARTYAITVSPVEWANFKISPTNLVVVEGGESKIVYLYATPKEGTEGEKVFVVNVRSGDLMKQVALQANVQPAEEEEETSSSWGGLRQSLEIGLVVLVVLLVILGLVIVFNKLTGPKDEDEDEDEDEEAQTYY